MSELFGQLLSFPLVGMAGRLGNGVNQYPSLLRLLIFQISQSQVPLGTGVPVIRDVLREGLELGNGGIYLTRLQQGYGLLQLKGILLYLGSGKRCPEPVFVFVDA